VIRASVGVYVHIPFCERICPYCDFAVVRGAPAPDAERRYVRALLRELELRGPLFEGSRLASVYFGGGSPSLLQPESLAAILEALQRRFPPAGDELIEVTLEVNPSTVERGRLPAFRSLGVNRLSLGIQSFDDTVLRRMGRAHEASEGFRTLEAARAAGFDNLSLDLIFAAPGQDLARLEADLATAVSFAPEHVSCYELVVEEGTPFARADARGQLARAGEDEAADMLGAIEARLSAAGILRYELTNYARPGREAVHNIRYWLRQPVLGLGVGAWSSEGPREEAPHGARRANLRELAAYLSRVEAGESAEVAFEPLDADTARGEAVFLALRRREGLSASLFRREFGAPPRSFFASSIDKLKADGLLVENHQGDLRLSARGRLLADLACQYFV